MFSLKEHPLTSEDEKFVSLLIANAASKNPMTSYLMKEAIEDFDLNNLSLLEPLVEKKLLSVSSYRPALTNEAGSLFPLMSSSEWLLGVFSVGEILKPEHVRIHMSFVNAWSPVAIREPDGNMTNLYDVYQSGKTLWENASPSLRELLDVLDYAAINKEEVKIIT